MSNQQKAKSPSITVNGKTYKVKKKLKLLRRLYSLKDSEMDMETIEGMEELYQFMVDAFSDDEITMDVLEDELDIDEFFELFGKTAIYLKSTMGSKMGSLPKNAVGTSQS